MNAHIAELHHAIDTEKASIARGLDALEDKARTMVDWREPIRARPWDAVGLALLGGALLALVGDGRRRKETRAPASLHPQPEAPSSPRPPGVSSRVLKALTTFAVATAADVIHQGVPGRASTPDRPNLDG